jgi:hypothetical protein
LHFHCAADSAKRRGFRRLEASPDRPPYGQFYVAPGHQLGFNDLKAIEVARYLEATRANGTSRSTSARVIVSGSSSRRSTPRAAW